MTRYVIGPDVAIQLAHSEAVIRGEHQILASVLLRSQMLPPLPGSAPGEMTKDAGLRLGYVRGLRIRLPGTASSRTPPGRPPRSSGGLTRWTPSTSP
jgi:hypothetical protein